MEDSRTVEVASGAYAEAPAPAAAAASRFQAGRVATISAGHAVHDTYTGFLPPLLPVFIERLSLAKVEAGALSLFLQAPSLLQPLIGHAADRTSLRYLVIATPAVTSVLMSLLSIVPAYGMLAFLLALVGFSSAALHAVGPVMVGYLSGRRLGRGLGVWMVGGELGRTLGPIVIVSAIGILGLAGVPWLMIGGLGISAVLFMELRSVPGRRAADAPPPRPWREALRSMRSLLVPLGGVVLARAFMLSALTTYLPTFLSDEGASLWFAGAALSLLEAAGVAGAMVGGSLSDRLGRRSVLSVSMLATPLLMVAFLASGGWMRLPLLLLMGFAVLAVTPVVMALVQESVPGNRALANGIYMSISFGLRGLVILILGALGDLFGLRLAFAASAGMGLAGLPLVLLLPKGGRMP